MIEGTLTVMLHLVIFIGILGAVSAVVNVCEYTCKKEAQHRPISEDVRCVKIKSDDWVKRYFKGEFYPEVEQELPEQSEPIRKFVILEVKRNDDRRIETHNECN